jgi:hypothetical protein
MCAVWRYFVLSPAVYTASEIFRNKMYKIVTQSTLVDLNRNSDPIWESIRLHRRRVVDWSKHCWRRTLGENEGASDALDAPVS